MSILLSDIVTLEERGIWQGYVNMVFACGAGLGAPLGGILTDAIGWRWAFIGQGPLCAIAIAMGGFDAHYGGRDPSVRLSVAATVIVSLDEEGAVSSVRFDPPLEPPFMRCVFDALRPGKFVGTTGPVSVPFNLGR